MPDLRLAAQRRDEVLERRLERIVPALMRENDIDCWIVMGREYAEDPLLRTMLPATWLSARRRTILVFYDDGSGVERSAIARYDLGNLFDRAWQPEQHPDQWSALAHHLRMRDPATIALNTSVDFAHADGMTKTQHDALMAALPADLSARVVSSQPLAVGWLETRLDEEKATMSGACAEAHQILGRGLSVEGITPGQTTTEDLEWWYRQTVHEIGLESWFHPSASIQRPGKDLRGSFAAKPSATVIEKGDLVHVDFGIVADGLCTDQQQHGYVLRTGESAAPSALVQGMALGNKAQDVLMREFAVDRTGNEVLSRARARAEEAGLDVTIYTHPIGYHGHGAGPTIGLWDQQDGVPGSGDWPLSANTAFSIELMVLATVPEWGDRSVRIMLEEDAWFDGSTCVFLDGRQEALHLVGSV